MTRQRLSVPTLASTDLEVLLAPLGAAELDPSQVPEHWLDQTGPDFAIYVEGTGINRPTYSPREAGKVAVAALQALEFRAGIGAALKAKGIAHKLMMPRFLAVVVCQACNEVQLASSSDLAGTAVCQVCPPTDPCPKGTKHKPGTRAPCCAQAMDILWKTTDPIPEDWLT